MFGGNCDKFYSNKIEYRLTIDEIASQMFVRERIEYVNGDVFRLLTLPQSVGCGDYALYVVDKNGQRKTLSLKTILEYGLAVSRGHFLRKDDDKGDKTPIEEFSIKTKEEIRELFKAKISAILKERNITKLIHFTSRKNYESIMTHGLLSKENLQMTCLNFVSTDPNKNIVENPFIHLSITNCNKYMIEKKIEELGYDDFIIIEIDPTIIIKDGAWPVFSNTNYAKHIKEESGKARDLEILFEDNMVISTPTGPRELNRIGKKANEPTDIQAEVLIRDRIPKKYFMKIYSHKNGEILWQKN